MTSNDEHLYEVTVDWKEGRTGVMSSEKLDSTIEVATPPEFPGGVEGVWSPEHLFTASVSSCFFTSFTAVAEYSKFEFESLKVTSFGKMSKQEGKFVMSEITLKPVLTISDESQLKKAYRLIEKAEEICLITRSVKSTVICKPDVQISVNV
jgi:peroxiredoxin-like protein